MSAVERCPTARDLARFVDGGSSPSEIEQLNAHALECARCHAGIRELRELASTLSLAPLSVENAPDLAPLVLARAALPPPRRTWTRPVAFATAVAAALALGVGLERSRAHRPLLEPVAVASAEAPDRDEPGFQRRGAATPSPDAWIAVRPFALAAGGARPMPLHDGDTVDARAALLFGYDNGGPAPYRHVAVFSVDASGRITWYFPDVDRGGRSSIEAQPGMARELREEVPYAGACGPIDLHAVFSPVPLAIGDIERAVAAARTDGSTRLPLAGTGQHRLQLKVRCER